MTSHLTGCLVILTNIFMPDFRMFAYEVLHHLHAFFRVQIDNLYPSRTEPVEAAAKRPALAYRPGCGCRTDAPGRYSTSSGASVVTITILR